MNKNKQPAFKSKLEQTVWNKAHNKIKRRRNKPKFSYESRKVPYVLVKNYVIDMLIERPNGTETIVEIKGYLRPEDRTKMIAVKKLNPELDIRFVFASDNKLNKRSRTRYSDWARKNGFPYAIGEIPSDWMTR